MSHDRPNQTAVSFCCFVYLAESTSIFWQDHAIRQGPQTKRQKRRKEASLRKKNPRTEWPLRFLQPLFGLVFSLFCLTETNEAWNLIPRTFAFWNEALLGSTCMDFALVVHVFYVNWQDRNPNFCQVANTLRVKVPSWMSTTQPLWLGPSDLSDEHDSVPEHGRNPNTDRQHVPSALLPCTLQKHSFTDPTNPHCSCLQDPVSPTSHSLPELDIKNGVTLCLFQAGDETLSKAPV